MDEEAKKYEEVSEQNQPDQKPVLPDVGDLSINTSLTENDKDRLELARKKAEAAMPLDVLANEIRRQASQYAPESDEDREKRERREKSKRIIGAVTDGLSALGNLYFTSQYAPNMYNHEKQSQLAAVNRWADKLKADREARRDRYDALQGKIGQLGLEKARTLREVEAAFEAQKIARERARREEEEAKRKAKMFEPQYQEALSKAEGAGYDAQTKKAAADAAPEQQRLKTENLGLEGQVKKSQIYKNTQQGKNAGNGGSRNEKYFNVEDPDGNVIQVNLNDLNDYYAQSDQSIRNKYKQDDGWGGTKTPTLEEMKQVVTEHIGTLGNTYRQKNKSTKGKGYGSNTSSDKGKGAGY